MMIKESNGGGIHLSSIKFTLLCLVVVTLFLYMFSAPVRRNDIGEFVNPVPIFDGQFSKWREKLKRNPSTPVTLIDLENFHYTIHSNICKDADDIFIITFIHSAPKNIQNRNAIRSSWGNATVLSQRGLVVRTVFLLAVVEQQQTQKDIERESEEFGDIIQGNFIDSYRNLTYKQVMGMDWVSSFCKQAKFVLKTDDDIFVDIFQLADYLQTFDFGKNSFLCNVWVGMPVLRDKTSKWYVSEAEYPAKSFTPYCSGWGFVTTPPVCRKIVTVASELPYFWVDDCHVSGTLADRAGVRRKSINTKYTFGVKPLEQWLLEKADKPIPFIFGPSWSNAALTAKLWTKTLKYDHNFGFEKWKRARRPMNSSTLLLNKLRIKSRR